MNNTKKWCKNKKTDYLIILILLILSFTSIVFKTNMVLLLEAFFIGIIFIWYIFINEKRLMIFTILGILLTPSLTILNAALSKTPYIVIFLLWLKLVHKIILKQEIKFNKIIVFSTVTVFFINVFSLIYNQYDCSIILILFYSLKKFSFIILYLFFINANITKKDIKNNLNIIIIFAILQFVVVTIQFAGGIRQDRLGGMFGPNDTGTMIQFLSIVVILITVLKQKFSKIPFFDLIIMMLCLIYSAMGEVKIGFVIIPFVYLFTLLLKGKKEKVVITICILFFSISAIYASLITLYPEQDILLNFSDSEDYLQNAYGYGQVNRIGFMPLLKSTILDTTEKQLFGTGLATINPSTSGGSLQGPLMEKYGYMNIHYFALPYSIAENGIIGNFIWLMIYGYILIKNIREYLKNKSNKSIINIVLIIDTFIFIFYNSSILTSFPIILIFWFLIPFFNDLDEKNKSDWWIEV